MYVHTVPCWKAVQGFFWKLRPHAATHSRLACNRFLSLPSSWSLQWNPFFLKPQQLHNFNQPHTLSHFAASKWIYRTSRLWRLCLAAAFTWVLRIFNLQVDDFLFTWCQAEHPAVEIRLWVAPGSHNSNLATEVESGVSVEFNLIVVTVERWIRTFNALKKKYHQIPFVADMRTAGIRWLHIVMVQ